MDKEGKNMHKEAGKIDHPTEHGEACHQKEVKECGDHKEDPMKKDSHKAGGPKEHHVEHKDHK
jgi:hypothetical protein